MVLTFEAGVLLEQLIGEVHVELLFLSMEALLLLYLEVEVLLSLHRVLVFLLKLIILTQLVLMVLQLLESVERIVVDNSSVLSSLRQLVLN